MTLEQIKDLRDRTPFRPFRLHLTSGATVAVVCNDHLLFSPDWRQLVLFLSSGAVWVFGPGRSRRRARKAGQRPALRVGQSRVLPERRRPRRLYTDLTPETNDET